MIDPPSPELSARFRSYLLPGERILWTGRPVQGLLFQLHDIFLIPFSVVWTALPLSSFWSDIRSSDGLPLPFSLIPVMFVAVGAYITVGRFLVDMAVRARLTYAVTDRRVLALRTIMGVRLISQDISNLSAFEFNERGNGRGTLNFSPSEAWWLSRGMQITPSLTRGLRFLGIVKARSVYELISDEMRRSRT